jgi:phosphoribosylaminoimidazole-succinocarboxamide synthase
MTFATLEATVGHQLAGHLQTLSLALYTRGQDLAEPRGLILADTKFEFGMLGDELLLIDELFTPDSSRFWPQDGYQPGRPSPSFDKQFVLDYVTTLGWNRQPLGPGLPAEIVRKTRERYLEAYRRLVGAEPQGV